MQPGVLLKPLHHYNYPSNKNIKCALLREKLNQYFLSQSFLLPFIREELENQANFSIERDRDSLVYLFIRIYNILTQFIKPPTRYQPGTGSSPELTHRQPQGRNSQTTSSKIVLSTHLTTHPPYTGTYEFYFLGPADL